MRLDVELVNRLMVVHLSFHPQVALSDVRRKKGECDWTQQVGPLPVVISASSSDTGVRTVYTEKGFHCLLHCARRKVVGTYRIVPIASLELGC